MTNLVTLFLGKILNYKKMIVLVLAFALLAVWYFYHFVPMQHMTELKNTITEREREIRVLRDTCKNERFEDKWVRIAEELKDKQREGGETRESQSIDFVHDGTIRF